MSDFHPLNLVAFASEPDEPLIPPLEQVVIFTKMLGYICELEPQRLPKKPFDFQPCPFPDPENSDEGVGIKGIDFFGLYEYQPNEVKVTLFICRIREFSAKHGFHPEDMTKIVLIHELAHFVTHLGESKCEKFWAGFCTAESETKEEFAQEATHLLLRVAGYGHLVQVFDALSHLCPPKYDTWRQTWKQQLKDKNNLEAILTVFRKRILKLRPCFDRACMVTDYDPETEL
jgi:hypothetical protein